MTVTKKSASPLFTTFPFVFHRNQNLTMVMIKAKWEKNYFSSQLEGSLTERCPTPADGSRDELRRNLTGFPKHKGSAMANPQKYKYFKKKIESRLSAWKLSRDAHNNRKDANMCLTDSAHKATAVLFNYRQKVRNKPKIG